MLGTGPRTTSSFNADIRSTSPWSGCSGASRRTTRIPRTSCSTTGADARRPLGRRRRPRAGARRERPRTLAAPRVVARRRRAARCPASGDFAALQQPHREEAFDDPPARRRRRAAAGHRAGRGRARRSPDGEGSVAAARCLACRMAGAVDGRPHRERGLLVPRRALGRLRDPTMLPGTVTRWRGSPPAARLARGRHGTRSGSVHGLPAGTCARMTARYLRDQIDRSRANLGLETLDVYYLHNPETQLDEVERGEFLIRMRAAFEALEEAVSAGSIARYGTATWTGFRADPDAPDYLSLAELVAMARDVGGNDHHFNVIQLPYNLGMTEAFTRANQRVDGGLVPVLQAARQL